MKFVDYVTITVRSGSGGPGAVAFRREKYVPKGGPAGGDGGRGGSVYLEADPNLNTLLDLRYKRHHFAKSGEPGKGSNQKGKDAEDIIIRVPPGTIARNTDTGEIIGEVIHPGDRLLLARGGRGGKGNAFFKSPTRQTPRFAQPGEPGEEVNVTLELKLLADVGLVGFPNAGKSTLISALSAAKPKIADYPFTTLTPNLGVVDAGDFRTFVMADIPGIIEGAHEGKGLGLRFLKHIERNPVLLFVIPVVSSDPYQEYQTLLKELEAYDPHLLEKPRMVALTMMDLLPPAEQEKIDTRALDFPENLEVIPVSAVSGYNIPQLKERLWETIQQVKKQEEVSKSPSSPVK